MSDTADLKKKLEEKSTTELQHFIRNNHLTEKATEIARTIIEERGAIIPEAIPEEILEERYKKARSSSNRSFFLTIVILCYGYFAGLFEISDQKHLNRNILIMFLSIALIWGWDVFGKKK